MIKRTLNLLSIQLNIIDPQMKRLGFSWTEVSLEASHKFSRKILGIVLEDTKPNCSNGLISR